MKFYIAGPMQGYENFNFPMFEQAAELLRGLGHQCFSPAERDIARHGGVDISAGNKTGDIKLAEATHGFNLNEALADDTDFICKEADAILMLPGWEHSSGALAEWTLAKALKRTFVYWQGDLVLMCGILGDL